MHMVRPHGEVIRTQIVNYVLKTLLIIFGVLVVLSYGYWIIVGSASDTKGNAQIILPIVVILPFVLGWLIDRKLPGHRIAFLFLVMAYSSAFLIIVEGRGLLYEFLPPQYFPSIHSIMLVLGNTMWLPGVYIPLFLMPLFFPTGKLLSPRWRTLVVAILINLAWTFVSFILRPWPWLSNDIVGMRPINGIPGTEPFFDATGKFSGWLLILAFPFIGLALYLRYRRSRGIERIQMKWPLFAFACFICVAIILDNFPAPMKLDVAYDYVMTWSLSMLFPISIGIAILRHDLWDIDIIINRTLVYGSLTALIVAIYVVIVGGLGMLFQVQTNALISLAAAGIIAVLFQPLREILQRRVSRMLYGERDDPAAVLTRLAHHPETAETPSAILPNLVETIAYTLKIPHVAIWLPAGIGQMEPVAVWGEATNQTQTIPLTYQKQAIGKLVVAWRGPHEQFNRHERDLLTTIAALTATVVRAVQLAEELHRSRQRIVTAREDERRRLRRDLHDGLGPQLASQTLGLEAVAQLMPANPEKAQVLLNSLKMQAQEAIQGVRRLVYDLRPPALDNLGLAGALQQSAARYETDELRFNFDMPAILPELPAAVEIAVYRIALEAMTNVVHHARATLCSVRLFCTDSQVIIEVRDNGRGLAQNHPSGVGLQAMRERTTELNGQFVLESLPSSGTLVQARLPRDVYGE
jgi:signal transduction histidine kinase